jgi:hypothetical protein
MVLRPTTATTTTSYTIESASFEAHGEARSYDPYAVKWLDSTHAAITIGLNSHAVWNAERESSPVHEGGAAGVVIVGDFFGDSTNTWYPYASDTAASFVQLGLHDGAPINDQVWARFQGRLGDSYHVDLDGAHYFDGDDLNTLDWAFVKIVCGVGELLGKLAPYLFLADGPAKRSWIVIS